MLKASHIGLWAIIFTDIGQDSGIFTKKNFICKIRKFSSDMYHPEET